MSLFDFFKNVTLTNNQETILGDLESFLTSINTPQVYILRGYAGTGKTFIAKGIINYIVNSLNRNVCCMAPTGRAAKVLNKKTGYPTSTIHKYIYQIDDIKTKESLKENKFKIYYELAQNELGNSSIYIIDEASMLSDIENDDEFFRFGTGRVLLDVINYVNFVGNPNNKIIFIGDNAQLPPIRMPYSPALLAEYIQNKFSLKTWEGEMVEVVRQKQHSGILQTATQVRDSLADKNFSTFQLIKASDITEIDEKDVVQQYLQFKKLKESSIIIVYSNKQALAYNLAIRQIITPNYPKTLAAGDLLLITQNNYNSTPQLMNGDFGKVLDVLTDPIDIVIPFNVSQQDIDTMPNKENIVVNKIKKSVQISFRFRKVRLKVESSNGVLEEISILVLENMLFDNYSRLSSIEQRALYIDLKYRFKIENPNLNKEKEKELFKKALKNDIYFNALKTKFGYAITCHKAQGGEWDCPIVDFKTNMSTKSSAFFRWAYTAITRASKQLFVVNVNPHTPLSTMLVNKTIRLISSVPSNAIVRNTVTTNLEVSTEASSDFAQECQNSTHIEIIHKFKNTNITVEVLLKELYKVRYKFNTEEESLSLDIYFKKNKKSDTPPFINGQPNLVFKDRVLSILKGTSEQIEPLERVNFNYNSPTEYQSFLYQTLKELASELELEITNIENLEYRDRYYLRATQNHCITLDFIYNSKGIYRSLEACSTLGSLDNTLINLLNQL